MKPSKTMYRIKDKNYLSLEKYLYITTTNEWLLVRKRGTINIEKQQFQHCLSKETQMLFERVEE